MDYEEWCGGGGWEVLFEFKIDFAKLSSGKLRKIVNEPKYFFLENMKITEENSRKFFKMIWKSLGNLIREIWGKM